MNTPSPLYLLADSQLLFWKQNEQLFLKSILNYISEPEPSAAYIGASNGDQQDFYQIFESAMDNIGIKSCHMIQSGYSDEDKKNLDQASIILLAGGDVKLGWDTFEATGMKSAIYDKYASGTVLIGVSAGAVQLGMCALHTDAEDNDSLFDTFQILPFIIGAHEESTDWKKLNRTVTLKDTYSQGVGIRSGAGFIYHADHTVEPLRHSLYNIIKKDQEITSSLLLPNPEIEKLQLH